MIRTATLAAVAILTSAPALAQQAVVLPCDERIELDAVPEPWGDHTRSFANGDVRLAVIDTIEPAVAAIWLAVLSPPFDPLGARQCRMVGVDGAGFFSVDLDALGSNYDPSQGLLFDIAVDVFVTATNSPVEMNLGLVVNQATGAIQADVTF